MAEWTRVVQRCFKRHSAHKIAVSPKSLRSAFITFLKDQRDAELVDVPGVLKSAAIAMRHNEAMQGDACYDKAKYDRAIAKAVDFCETYARSFNTMRSVVSPAA